MKIQLSLPNTEENLYICKKSANNKVKYMILEFCVSNFLSIKDELKLSFVATTLKESLSEPNDVIPLSDMGLSLVRSAVIYGANASGKTNVLKAIAFYKRFIMDSFKNSQAGESIDVENFRLNISTVHEPTTMEATFAVGEYIYRYGFEVDQKTVHAEWLYRRMNRKRAKEVEIFYREGETTTVHAKSPLIQDLVNKKMVRGNALLLSTAAQFNETTAVNILHWLGDTQVLFCSEDEKMWSQAIRHLDDEKMRERIVRFAKYADLGIDNIAKIDNRIVSSHRQYDDEGKATHNVAFSFNGNESEGTIKYFSLAYPIIDALDNGKRLVVMSLTPNSIRCLCARLSRFSTRRRQIPKERNCCLPLMTRSCSVQVCSAETRYGSLKRIVSARQKPIRWPSIKCVAVHLSSGITCKVSSVPRPL